MDAAGLWLGLGGLVAGAVLSPLVRRLAIWAPNTAGVTEPPHWRFVTPASALAVGLAATGAPGAAALPAYVLFAVVGAALALVDARLHRLPDRLTLGGLGAAVPLLALASLVGGDWLAFGRACLGAVAVFAAYLAMHLAAPSGLGRGDVKYAAAVGLHLAYLSWASVVLGTLLAFVVGAIVGVASAVRRPSGLRTRIAFGPAMVTGALGAVALGSEFAATWLGWAG